MMLPAGRVRRIWNRRRHVTPWALPIGHTTVGWSTGLTQLGRALPAKHELGDAVWWSRFNVTVRPAAAVPPAVTTLHRAAKEGDPGTCDHWIITRSVASTMRHR